MDQSIGDMLNNVEPEAVEAPIEQAVEAQPETVDRPRGPDGKFVSKETGVEPTAETAAETVPPTADRLPHAEYVALKDERTKRQQAEDRVREYEQMFAQLNRPQVQPQEEPDMFADPDAFKAHLAKQIRDDLLNELQPQFQQQRVLSRAEMSEMQARTKYEDYDAKIEVFKEAIRDNPFLLTQIQQAPDPATFAYNAANKYLEAQQYGGTSPSRAQIEAEIRDQIKAELGLERPQAPSTFAGDRSVGARSGPAWTGPLPLGDMLK